MNPDCTAKKLKAVGYTLDCPFFNGQYYISLVAVTYVAVLDPGLKEGSYVRRRFKDANVLPTYSAEGIPANALCLPIPEFYEWLKLHQPGRGYYKRFIKDFESQCEKLFGFTIQ